MDASDKSRVHCFGIIMIPPGADEIRGYWYIRLGIHRMSFPTRNRFCLIRVNFGETKILYPFKNLYLMHHHMDASDKPRVHCFGIIMVLPAADEIRGYWYIRLGIHRMSFPTRNQFCLIRVNFGETKNLYPFTSFVLLWDA